MSDNETGYNYNAILSKNFKHGNLTIGGRGGWDESYLDAERTGFTRFWSAETRFEYLLMKSLSTYLGGSFRQNKDSENRKWGTWRANCGLRLSFYRWFSLSLDYTYAQRDDDIDTEDFVENMVMLSLTANRLLRW